MLSLILGVHATILAIDHLFAVIMCRPLLRLSQHLLYALLVSWDQLNLEITRNGHERALELVVINVIRVGWLALAGNNLVATEYSDQRRVQ